MILNSNTVFLSNAQKYSAFVDCNLNKCDWLKEELVFGQLKILITSLCLLFT